MSIVDQISTTTTPEADLGAMVRPRATRVGVVNYINTLPLITGLERLEGLTLVPEVPSRQIDMILSGEVDFALCSVIDLVHAEQPMSVVPVGMLGCSGPTLTVRLFSSVPFEKVRRVHCDSDSHTSVALLKVLCRERYGCDVEIIPFDASVSPVIDGDDAVLLIGDKVVTHALPQALTAYEMDLGESWFEMTSLPFVFATWLCRRELIEEEHERIVHAARILDRTRRRNVDRLHAIAASRHQEFGWPDVSLARHYLDDLLRFELDDKAIRGMTTFLELAAKHTEPISFIDWS
jgi:chorismate dehydratase